MTMPWENSDSNSWNNNSDSSNDWSKNNSENDNFLSDREEKELEDLFAQEEEDQLVNASDFGASGTRDDSTSASEYVSHDVPGESKSESSDSDDVQSEHDKPSSLEEVEKEISESPVKRSQTTPQFSERDVYRIVNLNSVLGVLDKEQSSWVDSIFGTAQNSDDIKRSVRIVSMDSDEIDDKIKPVEALQSLYKVHQETDASKIIDNLLASIKIIDDLSTNDQANLVSLMRKMAKNHAEDNDGKVVSIRVTRKSSSAEIVDAMKKLLEENPAVSSSISSLSQCIDVIKSALK